MNKEIELLEITSQLMKTYGVPLRDTWKGIHGQNLDDFYSNGNKCYGDRLLKIEQLDNDDKDPHIVAKKKYVIADFKHVAYDAFKVRIPARFRGMNHPIVHELVHFLQENTFLEDNAYIKFNGENYIQYVSQRSEVEAHFIQCLYIREFEPNLINQNNILEIDLLISDLGNHENRLKLILLCNRLNII